MRALRSVIPLSMVCCLFGQPLPSHITIGHYQIPMPAGFKVGPSKTKMMDFEIFDLINPKGTKVASIYLGNNPNFPINDKTQEREVLPQGVVFTGAKIHPVGQQFLIECTRVTMGRHFSPWQCIHVFGITLDEPEAKLLYEAFRQIKVTYPNL